MDTGSIVSESYPVNMVGTDAIRITNMTVEIIGTFANWTPKETPPEKYGWYLATHNCLSHDRGDVRTNHYSEDGWLFKSGMKAWAHLPEPYRGEK